MNPSNSHEIKVVYVDDDDYNPEKMPAGTVPFLLPHPPGKPAQPKRIKMLYKAIIENKRILVGNIIKKLTRKDHEYIQNTPLWYAAFFNKLKVDLEMFKVLSTGCDFAVNDNRHDIFHMLTIDHENKNNCAIAKYVIEEVIGIEQSKAMLSVPFNGLIALFSASIYSMLNIFQLYFTVTPKDAYNSKFLLEHAISAGNMPVCDYLLRNVPDISTIMEGKRNASPFIIALNTPREQYLNNRGFIDSSNNANYAIAALLVKYNADYCLCECDADGLTGLDHVVKITGDNLDELLTKECSYLVQLVIQACLNTIPQQIILNAYLRIVDATNIYMANMLAGCLDRNSLATLRLKTKEIVKTNKSGSSNFINLLMHKCDYCNKMPMDIAARTIVEIMYCLCKTAVYCNDECAAADWKNHKKTCSRRRKHNICGECGNQCNKKCLCGKVKYCNDECAIADWKNHKKTCSRRRKHNICGECGNQCNKKCLCRKVKYCNDVCAIADWKNHRNVCLKNVDLTID